MFQSWNATSKMSSNNLKVKSSIANNKTTQTSLEGYSFILNRVYYMKYLILISIALSLTDVMWCDAQHSPSLPRVGPPRAKPAFGLASNEVCLVLLKGRWEGDCKGFLFAPCSMIRCEQLKIKSFAIWISTVSKITKKCGEN